jgi:hypothetical protein
MVELSTILEVSSGASTIAVIPGIPFIILQMRQNARLVGAAKRQSGLVALQSRSEVMLTIAEHTTDHDFILQRKTVSDIIAKRSAGGWDGFVNGTDGFEVRAFALQYESAAIMAKLGLIDEATVLETLGFVIAIDWIALSPAIAEFQKVWVSLTFPNFQHLAARFEEYWKQRGARLLSPDSLILPNRSAGE